MRAVRTVAALVTGIMLWTSAPADGKKPWGLTAEFERPVSLAISAGQPKFTLVVTNNTDSPVALITNPEAITARVTDPDGEVLEAKPDPEPYAKTGPPRTRILAPGGNYVFRWNGLYFPRSDGVVERFRLKTPGRHRVSVTYDPKRVAGWEKTPAGKAALWTRAVEASPAEVWYYKVRRLPEEAFRTPKTFEVVGSAADPDNVARRFVGAGDAVTFLYNFGDVPVSGYVFRLDSAKFDGRIFTFNFYNQRPDWFPRPARRPERLALAVDLGRLPEGVYHIDAFVTDKRWRRDPKTSKQWEKDVRIAPAAKGGAK